MVTGIVWGGEEEEVLGETEEELISLTPVTRAGPGLVRLLSGTETHMTGEQRSGLLFLVFRDLWSVISEMATWSESTERGWYLGHGRRQVVR